MRAPSPTPRRPGRVLRRATPARGAPSCARASGTGTGTSRRTWRAGSRRCGGAAGPPAAGGTPRCRAAAGAAGGSRSSQAAAATLGGSTCARATCAPMSTCSCSTVAPSPSPRRPESRHRAQHSCTRPGLHPYIYIYELVPDIHRRAAKQPNRHPSLFPHAHAPLRTFRDGAVAPTDIVQPAPSRRVHAALGRAEGKPLEPAAALSVSAS